MLDSHPHPALAFGGFTVMNESPREHTKLKSLRFERSEGFFAITGLLEYEIRYTTVRNVTS
jgi:hypothetical protein